MNKFGILKEYGNNFVVNMAVYRWNQSLVFCLKNTEFWRFKLIACFRVWSLIWCIKTKEEYFKNCMTFICKTSLWFATNLGKKLQLGKFFEDPRQLICTPGKSKPIFFYLACLWLAPKENSIHYSESMKNITAWIYSKSNYVEFWKK